MSEVRGDRAGRACTDRSNASLKMVAWGPSLRADRHEREHYLNTTPLVDGKKERTH